MKEPLALVVARLKAQYGYWGEHPACPVTDWQYEVSNEDTRMGYWEYVAFTLDMVEPDLEVKT